MPKVNFDPSSLPPNIGKRNREIISKTITRLRIEDLLKGATTLDELRKIAREVCTECKNLQIGLGEVLEELSDGNVTLKNKIEATKLKTLQGVVNFLKSKDELKDFILAMQNAIDSANTPRRFVDIREEVLVPRQIEFEPPKRKINPEIEFPPNPKPGFDFQS